jgi:hypothetical protein
MNLMKDKTLIKILSTLTNFILFFEDFSNLKFKTQTKSFV